MNPSGATAKPMMYLKEKIILLIKKYTTPNAARISAICSIISVSIALLFYFNSEANVDGYISKYNYRGVMLYSGKLINNTNVHADRLTFKGDFQKGEIIDFKINTMDSIEYQSKYDSHDRFVEFILRRLSKKNKCLFDIIIEPKGENGETFQVSWGKNGYLLITPQYVNDEEKRAIERGIDLSLKTRQNWLKSNTKNISKHRN